jgi:hypothetical protein
MTVSAEHMPATVAERIRKLEALAARPGTPGEGAAARAALARISERYRPRAKPTVKRTKACRCGSWIFQVEPGRAMHAYHLRCASCARGGTWMARAEAQQFDAAQSEASA